MTSDEQSNAVLMAEDDFPDRQQVVQRFGDLAPDGTTSTVALSRLFEHPRVGLRFSRFDKLTADDGFKPYQILFVGQRVERQTAFGKVGATVRIGTGIRAIGRSSYTYGQGMFVDGHLVATAEATIVLADESGPITLPDELLADLEELRLPETGAAVAAKPEPRRRERQHYPAAATVHSRVRDVDLNRHVNYIAQLGWYDEAIASYAHGLLGDDAAKTLPRYLPWCYSVAYLGEVLHPRSYDIGIAVSGHDEHIVHYELGLFDSGKCLGTADAAAPRGKLSATALAPDPLAER
ncbi:acyl-ACP thioesterase domain-containing protein [Amycolatopsis nigrescens]|uniref:acyl-ACP thioesterase domain-containing protein n=1 Tax=Amycolatopsis nigrescens TaxID=381445 RepID=UPI00036D67F9|nr:acyl-ACP thioesterase domain-containing protein [Amycolatopsis nigrescens]